MFLGDTVGSLLTKIDPKLEEEIISHVHISKTGSFLDPHVVPSIAPVSVCEQFHCMHVCIFSKRDEVVQPAPARTVNSVLMAATCERILPTLIVPTDGNLRGDQQLYNDVIGKSGLFQRIEELDLALFRRKI